jgi:hypothetical protein
MIERITIARRLQRILRNGRIGAETLNKSSQVWWRLLSSRSACDVAISHRHMATDSPFRVTEPHFGRVALGVPATFAESKVELSQR